MAFTDRREPIHGGYTATSLSLSSVNAIPRAHPEFGCRFGARLEGVDPSELWGT